MEEGHNNNDRHAAATHPLQDVPLSEETPPVAAASGMSEQQQQQQQPSNSKVNWVKFDDDVNEIGERNNTSIGTDAVADSISATRVTAAAAAAAPAEPAAAPNRLSPLPPPTASTTIRARPRTPTESKQHQDRTALVAPVPVQRTITATLPDVAPAVLTTESTHVNLNASGRAQQQQQQQQSQQQPQQQHQKFKVSNVPAQQQQQQIHHNSNNGGTAQQQQQHQSNASSPAATTMTSSVSIPVESTGSPMRTIELSTGRIREGFANGDVIVTLLPANTKWPWITPAIFRPELVPEELMAQGLTLTVEDYVNAMETLVNDYRFTVYNICYKRILVCWILFAFGVLLTLLFSGLQGVALFSLGVAWLFLNAAAIFICMWVKLRLSRGLEKCLARVNRQLMKHKILLVLDDRGRISCHKVNLCFMYFDAAQCVNFLNEFLEQTEQNGGEAIKAGWEAKLDIDLSDIVIQGNNPVRLSRKQAVAQELFLTYLQRWGKDFLRRRLDWTVQEAGVHEIPRHLQSSICPCQYEEELLRNKIKLHMQRRRFCDRECIGCWY